MQKQKFAIYAGIGLFLTIGIAASHKPVEKGNYKNLKVIPENTDEEQMDRIMHKISQNLAVTCLYCHPFTKPGIVPKDVDFVTDELPAKVVARKMMVMTDRINKKYFGFTNKYDLQSLNKKKIVTCTTCHRGSLKPQNIKFY